MKFKSSLVAAVVVFGGVIACGHGQEESTTTSIGTNLNSENTKLYWVDGDQIKRGTCDADRSVVLHATCENDVEYMNWEEFKTDLDGGLSDTIVYLEGKIVKVQRALDFVSNALVAAKKRLAQAEADLEATEEELAEARAEMEYLENIVFEYRQQLKFIEAELEAMKYPDQDLVEMGKHIAEQLETYRYELGDIYSSVKELTERVEHLELTIDVLSHTIGKLTHAFYALSKELKSLETELAAVRDMFAIYKNTVGKLEHRIIFVIKDDTKWFEANRRFVAMFEDIFATSGKKVW